MGDDVSLAVICARGGSKGLPGKNIRVLHGRPLLVYTIQAVQKSGLFPYLCVSSDCKNILRIAESHGAIPILRPDELATDTAGTIPALEHAIQAAEHATCRQFPIIGLFQPTSPLRTAEDIQGAWRVLSGTPRYGNVISVCRSAASPYYNLIERSVDGRVALSKPAQFIRRQDAPPVYEINGAIYMWRRHRFIETRQVLNEDTGIYVMPPQRSIDIDTELDFKLVQLLMEEDDKT